MEALETSRQHTLSRIECSGNRASLFNVNHRSFCQIFQLYFSPHFFVRTEFPANVVEFFDTWAALNAHHANQTLSTVLCFDEESGLHKYAAFAAQHWHPALSRYLVNCAKETLAKMVGFSGIDVNKTRLTHVAATHHQFELVQDLIEANADPRCQTEDGISVLSIASGSTKSKALRDWASTYGAFLLRYQIVSGPPVHRSATCVVVFAIECSTDKRVALKLMKHRNQFEAEITGRHTKSHTLLTDVVIAVSGWHTPEDEVMMDAVTERHQEQEHTPCPNYPGYNQYPYVLVMQCADRSLHDACAKERIAGFILSEIRHVARSIAECLQILHANGVCHGDLKQRNVIRLSGKWVLCDMDAAAHFDEPIGDKTSTAYCPPELARSKFSLETPVLDTAHPSFDIWSFGVVLFEMCSGQTLFGQDISNDELIDDNDKTRLCTWLVISDDDLAPVLSSPELQFDVQTRALKSQVVADVKNLIRWCLQGEHWRRPTIDDVLSHRFLSFGSEMAVDPSPQRMRYHGFLSHAQADASGTVGTLFHLYRRVGLHVWLDMRQQTLTLKGMREGVRDSDVFLLVLSERVLTSWFCQQELLCAIEHRKKIQLIVEKEPRFHPFGLDTWKTSKGADERKIVSSNQTELQVVRVTKDANCPWQNGQTNEQLTALLCRTIDEHLPHATTFRRRDFEQEAMMHELCRRNGIVLPTVTDQDESALALTSSSTVHIEAFVVCHTDNASSMVADIRGALAQHPLNATLTFDVGRIETADKVLLLLSKGVLTGASLSHLQQVLSVDARCHRDRIVSVYSEDAGWAFGCDEHRNAPEEVKQCLDEHEALSFRPYDPTGADRHEFPAMMGQLLKNLGASHVCVPMAQVIDEGIPPGHEAYTLRDQDGQPVANARVLAKKDEGIAKRDEASAEKLRVELAKKDEQLVRLAEELGRSMARRRPTETETKMLGLQPRSPSPSL
eukprot:COSAG04_NODE_269_length_18509_cov_13.576480_2_plen_958_part_00